MKSSRADFSECGKVGATFTPVPQGCRAEKAQLVIRSLGAVSLAGQSQDAAPAGCMHCEAGGAQTSPLTASTRGHKTQPPLNLANNVY